MVASMSSVGASLDYAVVERFFGSLKHEWLLNIVHLTRESMKQDVEEYIRYYNHERLHTTLGDLTPINYEKLQSQVFSCALPEYNAGYWEDGHPRNEAVKGLKTKQLAQWKLDNAYHLRSLSETAMHRYKQLLSPKLSLRDYNVQVGEALAGVKAINKS
jgi:hypothetical protein